MAASVCVCAHSKVQVRRVGIFWSLDRISCGCTHTQSFAQEKILFLDANLGMGIEWLGCE